LEDDNAFLHGLDPQETSLHCSKLTRSYVRFGMIKS